MATTDPSIAATCWACGSPAAPLPRYAPLKLYGCSKCGLGFQPTTPPSEVRDAYDADYFNNYGTGYQYSADGQRRYEARVRLRLIGKYLKPGRLLELGSASGFFLDEARKAGWKSVGIEPCDSVAREARNRGTNVVTGFVEDIDLPSASFDLVCGWHVLEHVPNPMPTIRRLRAALRPGGWMLFEVPNFGSIESQLAGRTWRYLDARHHVGQFTPTASRTLLANAGLHVVSVDTVPMVTYTRLAQLLRPRALVRPARIAWRTRTRGFGSHPDRFELLRITAQLRT